MLSVFMCHCEFMYLLGDMPIQSLCPFLIGLNVLSLVELLTSLYTLHVCMLSCLSCPTLCDRMDYSPPAPLSMGFSSKNTGVDCHALLQGIFLTQRSNKHLLTSPVLAGRFFTTSTTWEDFIVCVQSLKSDL